MKTKRTKDLVNIVTLGCSKNLVDSEYLMRQVEAGNIDVIHDSNSFKAKTVIINTCGFIQDAKQESVDTILGFVQAKQSGKVDRVFVMGCLSERYKKDLEKSIPEVDMYFGANDLKGILASLGIDYKKELTGERSLTTPSHYAYLKISEGCDRTCSFCAIPLMRGKHSSKPIAGLVDEAGKLAIKGVKELILIAQDLTYYGIDLNRKHELNDLLKRLADIKGIEWIRLHYAFPTGFPVDILKTMNERDNICKYLDIPVQHISNNVLKKMRRGHTKEQLTSLLEMIRKEVPGIALRTTMLIGHPGEGYDEFEELREFVAASRFDRLGAFVYSEEEGTFSARNYKDTISPELKQSRLDEIMSIQSGISAEINREKIGKTFKVIIDRREGDYFIGRTSADSPEVDNEVIIANNHLETGNFYDVSITSANEFDLYGEIN